MWVYWSLFAAGWVLVVITRIILAAVDSESGEEIQDKSVCYQIITITLMCICIVLVGGIANALWVGTFISKENSVGVNIGGAIFIDLLPAALTYLVGYFVLGLYKENRFWIHTIFVVTFVVSIVFWSIPIGNYNSNIEYKEETGISTTQEYELYYFCNIPVQQVSGSVSGTTIFGTGGVSGSISTSEQLPYWYDDGSGKALYNSVSADNSEIVFIEDGENPFIRIVTHYKKEIKVDNNVGEQTVRKEDTWTTYEFYLPKQVMQYNIG